MGLSAIETCGQPHGRLAGTWIATRRGSVVTCWGLISGPQQHCSHKVVGGLHGNTMRSLAPADAAAAAAAARPGVPPATTLPSHLGHRRTARSPSRFGGGGLQLAPDLRGQGTGASELLCDAWQYCINVHMHCLCCPAGNTCMLPRAVQPAPDKPRIAQREQRRMRSVAMTAAARRGTRQRQSQCRWCPAAACATAC